MTANPVICSLDDTHTHTYTRTHTHMIMMHANTHMHTDKHKPADCKMASWNICACYKWTNVGIHAINTSRDTHAQGA